ncbi:trichohyalin-like [Littorina saxatilis]|uniref:trichohyalin-like n=1 Tax=Littorina saxatilis TaxID=31220 RepID=UPI0038B53562
MSRRSEGETQGVHREDVSTSPTPTLRKSLPGSGGGGGGSTSIPVISETTILSSTPTFLSSKARDDGIAGQQSRQFLSPDVGYGYHPHLHHHHHHGYGTAGLGSGMGTNLERVPSINRLQPQSSTETSGLGETITSGFSSQESVHSAANYNISTPTGEGGDGEDDEASTPRNPRTPENPGERYSPFLHPYPSGRSRRDTGGRSLSPHEARQLGLSGLSPSSVSGKRSPRTATRRSRDRAYVREGQTSARTHNPSPRGDTGGIQTSGRDRTRASGVEGGGGGNGQKDASSRGGGGGGVGGGGEGGGTFRTERDGTGAERGRGRDRRGENRAPHEGEVGARATSDVTGERSSGGGSGGGGSGGGGGGGGGRAPAAATAVAVAATEDIDRGTPRASSGSRHRQGGSSTSTLVDHSSSGRPSSRDSVLDSAGNNTRSTFSPELAKASYSPPADRGRDRDPRDRDRGEELSEFRNSGKVSASSSPRREKDKGSSSSRSSPKDKNGRERDKGFNRTSSSSRDSVVRSPEKSPSRDGSREGNNGRKRQDSSSKRDSSLTKENNGANSHRQPELQQVANNNGNGNRGSDFVYVGKDSCKTAPGKENTREQTFTEAESTTAGGRRKERGLDKQKSRESGVGRSLDRQQSRDTARGGKSLDRHQSRDSGNGRSSEKETARELPGSRTSGEKIPPLSGGTRDPGARGHRHRSQTVEEAPTDTARDRGKDRALRKHRSADSGLVKPGRKFGRDRTLERQATVDEQSPRDVFGDQVGNPHGRHGVPERRASGTGDDRGNPHRQISKERKLDRHTSYDESDARPRRQLSRDRQPSIVETDENPRRHTSNRSIDRQSSIVETDEKPRRHTSNRSIDRQSSIVETDENPRRHTSNRSIDRQSSIVETDENPRRHTSRERRPSTSEVEFNPHRRTSRDKTDRQTSVDETRPNPRRQFSRERTLDRQSAVDDERDFQKEHSQRKSSTETSAPIEISSEEVREALTSRRRDHRQQLSGDVEERRPASVEEIQLQDLGSENRKQRRRSSATRTHAEETLAKEIDTGRGQETERVKESRRSSKDETGDRRTHNSDTGRGQGTERVKESRIPSKDETGDTRTSWDDREHRSPAKHLARKVSRDRTLDRQLSVDETRRVAPEEDDPDSHSRSSRRRSEQSIREPTPSSERRSSQASRSNDRAEDPSRRRSEQSIREPTPISERRASQASRSNDKAEALRVHKPTSQNRQEERPYSGRHSVVSAEVHVTDRGSRNDKEHSQGESRSAVLQKDRRQRRTFDEHPAQPERDISNADVRSRRRRSRDADESRAFDSQQVEGESGSRTSVVTPRDRRDTVTENIPHSDRKTGRRLPQNPDSRSAGASSAGIRDAQNRRDKDHHSLKTHKSTQETDVDHRGHGSHRHTNKADASHGDSREGDTAHRSGSLSRGRGAKPGDTERFRRDTTTTDPHKSLDKHEQEERSSHRRISVTQNSAASSQPEGSGVSPEAVDRDAEKRTAATAEVTRLASGVRHGQITTTGSRDPRDEAVTSQRFTDRTVIDPAAGAKHASFSQREGVIESESSSARRLQSSRRRREGLTDPAAVARRTQSPQEKQEGASATAVSPRRTAGPRVELEGLYDTAPRYTHLTHTDEEERPRSRRTHRAEIHKAEREEERAGVYSSSSTARIREQDPQRAEIKSQIRKEGEGRHKRADRLNGREAAEISSVRREHGIDGRDEDKFDREVRAAGTDRKSRRTDSSVVEERAHRQAHVEEERGRRERPRGDRRDERTHEDHRPRGHEDQTSSADRRRKRASVHDEQGHLPSSSRTGEASEEPGRRRTLPVLQHQEHRASLNGRGEEGPHATASPPPSASRAETAASPPPSGSRAETAASMGSDGRKPKGGRQQPPRTIVTVTSPTSPDNDNVFRPLPHPNGDVTRRSQRHRHPSPQINNSNHHHHHHNPQQPQRKTSTGDEIFDDLFSQAKSAKGPGPGGGMPRGTPGLQVEQINHEWERRESRGSIRSNRSRSSHGGSFRSRPGSRRGANRGIFLTTESAWSRWSRDRRASYRRRIELLEKPEVDLARVSTPVRRGRQEGLKFVHPDLEGTFLSEEDLNELRRHQQQKYHAIRVIEKDRKGKFRMNNKAEVHLTSEQWQVISDFWDHPAFVRGRYMGLFLMFVSFLVMVVSITHTNWVSYEAWNLTIYEGLWINCSTPIHTLEGEKCEFTDGRDWQNAVIGLMIFAASFGILASVLSICGVCTSPLPRKIYYFHSAGEIFIICALSTGVALMVFPIAIEIDRNISSHRYGIGYGLGWGGAFFFLAAAVCMSLDDLVREASRAKCCKWCWKSKHNDRTELRQV